MSDLLNAPERGAIEAYLLRRKPAAGPAPTFERLLGFLSGVAITPGGLMPSVWMQPLLDMSGIVFLDAEDAGNFMDRVMPLYNRLNGMRQRNENLCPFDWRADSDLEEAQLKATQWGIGLHDALRLRPDVWAPKKHEARHVPAGLLEEMEHTMAFIWAVADPDSVPHIVPDPVPFQRNFLSRAPGWKEEMLRQAWDDELVGMFLIMCLSRLGQTTDALQRYARAYEGGRRAGAARPPVAPARQRVGRNDPCPCGSGAKYKKCCGR